MAPEIDLDAVDRAFRLAAEIQRQPVEINFYASNKTFDDKDASAYAAGMHGSLHRYSFDHAVVDARSALALLMGVASERQGVERARLQIDLPRSYRVPRRQLRRMVRRLAEIPIGPAESPNDQGPVLIAIPRVRLEVSSGRSLTAEFVARLHALAHGAAVTSRRYSAILVPLDARPPTSRGEIGNYSSSELSIVVDRRAIDEEVEWFFPRARAGRAWSLWRLSRYGNLEGLARRFVIAYARFFRLPKETAIVSTLRLDVEVRETLSGDLFLEVPTRSLSTLPIGVVDAGPTVFLCVGSRRFSKTALLRWMPQFLPEIDIPSLQEGVRPDSE
ncbi:hypothetical protein [Microbacterium sp.]|uniref:hypothetical protein n=1 Tax=Microbacterium sp. TaxID=51671 RepID=UPI003C2A5105